MQHIAVAHVSRMAYLCPYVCSGRRTAISDVTNATQLLEAAPLVDAITSSSPLPDSKILTFSAALDPGAHDEPWAALKLLKLTVAQSRAGFAALGFRALLVRAYRLSCQGCNGERWTLACAGPLNRAEWVKFLGLFFNREMFASEYFTEVEAQYNATKALVAANATKPVVAWTTHFVFGKDEYYQMSFAPYKVTYTKVRS